MSNEGFYVRLGKETPEQEAHRDYTYDVAKTLRQQGIACEVTEYICFAPKDCPAVIELKERP